MKAYTYIEKGKFALIEKQKPGIVDPTDAIVRVTLSSICTSDAGVVPNLHVHIAPSTTNLSDIN